MTKQSKLLRSQDLRDKAVLTVEEFNPLHLSRMPKKVRIRVVGENGATTQVQHIGEHIHLKLLSQYLLPPVNKPEAATAIVEVADGVLRAAARCLESDQGNGQMFYSISNGEISVSISDPCTGEQPLAILTRAEQRLIACADELLSTFAGGIRRQPSPNTEW